MISNTYQLPVFAGLGSDVLFSERYLQTAVKEPLLPESRILLRACHRIFRIEVARALQQKILSPDIDLDDFLQAENLVSPPERYRRNIVIQHTTLYLAQILIYFRHKSDPAKLLGIAGFCAGLLPAASIATSTSVIELLSRGQDFFYVALWIGIWSEIYKQKEAPCQSSLPWSIVVDGISPEQVAEILDRRENHVKSHLVQLKGNLLTLILSQMHQVYMSAPKMETVALH